MRRVGGLLFTIISGVSFTALVGAGSASAQPASGPRFDHPTVTVDGYEFRVAGRVSLPGWLRIDGVPVGGLSGVDYDAGTGDWRAISDDSSDQGPARFYHLNLGLSGGNPAAGIVTLLRADGTPYPASATAGQDTVRPEGVRFDPTTGDLFWANAGERGIPEDGSAPTLVDPTVRQSGTDGHFVAQLVPSERMRASTANTGIRAGQGLSGLTFSANAALVISTAAGPLLQDGPLPTATEGAFTRITSQSRTFGFRVVGQFAYPLDALPSSPGDPAGLAGNEVAEILAVADQRYLVLERGFADGVGNSVRIYEVDLTAATNVGGVNSLVGATFTPASKRLLVDLGDLGLGGVANFQGITWGPALPSGERTLVLVSDNDFDQHTPTELLTLAVRVS